MPTQSKLPYLTGKLTDAQREKMTQFLNTSGVPDRVGQILFLNSIQMKQMKTMRRITDEHPGFSDLNQGRVFVPDTVLDNPAMAQDLLLHEFGHFDANSADENKAEQAARVRRSVYGAKSRASKVVGQLEPTRAPL